MTKRLSDEEFFCRVCLSNNIEQFKISHYGFPAKKENWKSFFCFECGSVSEFNIVNKVDYSDGSFRDREYININSSEKKVLPPIDPWSVMIFGRWEHIYKFLKSSTSIFLNEEIKMLDYGSYNGFLPYALKQKHKINSYVADLDPKGLNIAKFFGSNIINLSVNKIIEKNFDLITIVHVLEHLEKPIDQLTELKNVLSENGVVYAEVPNLYGFPLMNNYHTIAFSQQSLIKMFHSAGFEILDYGFNGSPKEIVKLGHIYGHDRENLYIIACKKINNKSLNFPNEEIPKNIKDFKYKIKITYAKLMCKKISYILIRPTLGLIKRCIIFFLYGLIDLITLKLFKVSIISKFLKQK